MAPDDTECRCGTCPTARLTEFGFATIGTHPDSATPADGNRAQKDKTKAQQARRGDSAYDPVRLRGPQSIRLCHNGDGIDGQRPGSLARPQRKKKVLAEDGRVLPPRRCDGACPAGTAHAAANFPGGALLWVWGMVENGTMLRKLLGAWDETNNTALLPPATCLVTT